MCIPAAQAHTKQAARSRARSSSSTSSSSSISSSSASSLDTTSTATSSPSSSSSSSISSFSSSSPQDHHSQHHHYHHHHQHYQHHQHHQHHHHHHILILNILNSILLYPPSLPTPIWVSCRDNGNCPTWPGVWLPYGIKSSWCLLDIFICVLISLISSITYSFMHAFINFQTVYLFIHYRVCSEDWINKHIYICFR